MPYTSYCTYTERPFDDDAEMISGCGYEWEDNEPLMENFVYCPYCGKKIKFEWNDDVGNRTYLRPKHHPILHPHFKELIENDYLEANRPMPRYRYDD